MYGDQWPPCHARLSSHDRAGHVPCNYNFAVLGSFMRMMVLLNGLPVLAKPLSWTLLVTVFVCCLQLKTLRDKSHPSGRYAAAVKLHLQQVRQHMQGHCLQFSCSCEADLQSGCWSATQVPQDKCLVTSATSKSKQLCQHTGDYASTKERTSASASYAARTTFCWTL